MTLILRKLLAYSSYAIASTLESLVTRLDNILNEKAIYIEDTIIDDVDFYEEFKDEVGEEDGVEIDFKINCESDKRVYALLSEKFMLFDGIFGESDEVLGTIEFGVDFEKKDFRNLSKL
ncbi:hypothetical protein [Clostridium sp.]|uniref:hypothetical protein n=1 Tax=Clostridium TaxID=1485 RepID=UPI0028FF5FC4|nr:hypothetical protein [Clostridium sp.]MDU2683607.1 hypothetical protein [Clostridium sp.]